MSGGGLGTQAILILGVSSIFADGLSMGLGEYLSSKAMNEYINGERKREEWELTHHRQVGEPYAGWPRSPSVLSSDGLQASHGVP